MDQLDYTEIESLHKLLTQVFGPKGVANSVQWPKLGMQRNLAEVLHADMDRILGLEKSNQVLQDAKSDFAALFNLYSYVSVGYRDFQVQRKYVDKLLHYMGRGKPKGFGYAEGGGIKFIPEEKRWTRFTPSEMKTIVQQGLETDGVYLWSPEVLKDILTQNTELLNKIKTLGITGLGSFVNILKRFPDLSELSPSQRVAYQCMADAAFLNSNATSIDCQKAGLVLPKYIAASMSTSPWTE